MKDFTSEWYQYPNSYISDFRITKGVARYKLSWWRRLFMPWTVTRFYRNPTHPFSEEN